MLRLEQGSPNYGPRATSGPRCDFIRPAKEQIIIDLTYYTAVRWLSCGKVLSRFFQLRNEIDIFLTEENHHEPLLSDTEWLWKLAFFC
jgi:hypothetical protein